ncbi:MAG: EamA family transporter [Bacteroidota bacterium]|nr:EamA family transporter [Bacteroidota bacterium]MDQ6889840.1 EamA family transporter [Bacteroidota bacterium]
MQDPSHKHAPLITVIIAFAIVYIVWGSTYFFIQASERDFPPFLLGAVRFFASGFLLLAWCAIKKYRLVYRPQIKTSFIVGNLLLFIGNGAIIWAETTLPSSFVAVLVSASPLWFVLFDGRNRKANFNNKHIIIGVVTGFAGVVLLFWEKIFSKFSPAADTFQVIYLLVIIAGSISWSIGSLYSKYNAGGNTMVGASWQMIFAAVSFLIMACFTGELNHFHLHQVHLRAWLSVIYLVTMGSLAGYSAYIWLLQVRPATQVSTNSYVNPVVAVLLGVFFGGEVINGLQIGALAIILSSVFIINFEKYKGNNTGK